MTVSYLKKDTERSIVLGDSINYMLLFILKKCCLNQMSIIK